ncbi:STAS domain-containing protein [Cytophaga hutchinsonii]|jgi:anti-sigma B factor antagonist|uniref:Anti-sigma factor antagonist n=1 Tax=Cytophaga hutchinsonii (strain ATCC 33406 / DSM 1761 / CIP 103989 / NBRC 15051 / NCIMB 9469 / D465) TaxID=269798 RepID=A0A6N4SRK0_CYTH3|nr:STAS domain-containing protein [Cytophaga hutchinsonii]ABG58969.1 anti-anti-sigma regulatory factor [Cytophaga hutchinsonii ATCC 33406]SFX39807.1 anti-sigma B factor antagonist [Cytophaga hutchinsonii ATCC 33406]
MKYNTYIKENILFLQLEGDLIGESNGLELMDLVSEKLNESITRCAIDLSLVRYMNSSGIGVLITLLTKFRNKGGELVLINPSEQIKKLLIITKLNSIFVIVETEAEALERLTK